MLTSEEQTAIHKKERISLSFLIQHIRKKKEPDMLTLPEHELSNTMNLFIRNGKDYSK